MKRLKALRFLVASAGIATLPLNAANVHVPIVSEAWTFIGVPGFQNQAGTSSSTSSELKYWKDTDVTSRVLVDAAFGLNAQFAAGGLELPTWDGNITSKTSPSNTTSGIDETALAGSGSFNGYSAYDARNPSTGTFQDILGKNYFATVGLMVLGQEPSSSTNTDVKSSTTDHTGAIIAAVNYMPKKKDYESAMRTMYIKSAGATAPDIKVIYQATYEGQTLYITAAEATYSSSFTGSTGYNILKPDNDRGDVYYDGVFSREYTYDNPAILGNTFPIKSQYVSTGSSSNTISGILASFDMNLSDNNFTVGSTTVTNNADSLAPSVDSSLAATNGDPTVGAVRQALEGNLTVLSWDSPSQSWRVYRSTGYYDSDQAKYVITEDASNDFRTFEKGKGYWVKLEKDLRYTYAATENYYDVSGFVLGDNGQFNHTGFINDGWNILNFGDAYLSYSTTGVIITATVGDLNITDTYGATSLNINLTNLSAEADCAIINASIDSNRTSRYTTLDTKCIPTETGMILVGNRKFTVQNHTTPTGLLGEALIADNNGSNTYYTSKYGYHGLVIEPNIGFGSGVGSVNQDANMSVEFPQATNGAQYAKIETGAAAVATLVTDLGTASTGTMAKASASLDGESNKAVAVDMNYDGVADAVMMVSNYRFFIKDATLVQAWQYYGNHEKDLTVEATCSQAAANGYCEQDENTTIKIIGKLTNTTTMVDDNLSKTASNINGLANGTTEINASVIDSIGSTADHNRTTMVLYYTGAKRTHNARISYFSLQEQANGQDVFMEVPVNGSISSVALDNRTNDGSAKTDLLVNVKNPFYGGIAKVWQISDLASSKQSWSTGGVNTDGNYSTTFIGAKSTSDLKYQALFAESYPTSGPLYDLVTTYNKKPELIITGHTEAGGAEEGYTIGSGQAGSLGNYVSWKQLDATINPKEWYDADNQFELFWTEKEKGYWVYLNGASSNNLTLGASLTLSKASYTYFNNYFGSSSTTTTRNHIDYTATVSTSGLFNAADTIANTDAYEVFATINGNKVNLERASGGTSFTFKISSHETPGIDFDYGTIDIVITAALASGQKVSQTYSVDYNKPVIESVTANGAVFSTTITNADATEIQVYAGDINDSSYGTTTATNGGLTPSTKYAGTVPVTGVTTAVNVGGYSAFVFPTSITGDTAAGTAPLATTDYDAQTEQSARGLVSEVHMVAKDSENLYSDQYKAAYIAFYSGSAVLSSQSSGNGETGATGWDIHPKVYNTDGTVNTNYDGGNTGIDDGVQLKSAIDGTDITCVYAHNDNVVLDQGAILTNNLVIGSSTVGVIGYRSEMDRKPFYCTTNGLLYVGQFKDRNHGTNDEDIELVKLIGVDTLTLAK